MKAILLLFVLVAALPALCFGQASSDGTDFYIGYLRPSYNDQDLGVFNNVKESYRASVFVSSYAENQITVSYFDASGQEAISQVYPVGSLQTVEVSIDISKMQMMNPGEVAEFKSMHITSLFPVSIQFNSSGGCSGGSFLAIPTEALGKNYVVESYHDNPVGKGGLLTRDNSCGYFMVVAAFDNTTLMITPNTTTKGGHVGKHGTGSDGTVKPYVVGLKRGQCYMVKSESASEQGNISGSTIISDKPVAVISGHENAFTDASNVGGVNVDARDFMIEQMLPVEYWDTTGYVSIPLTDSRNADGGDGDEYIVYYGKDVNAPIGYPAIAEVKIDAVLTSSIKAIANPDVSQGKRGVTSAINAFSTNGAKFHIVQYDQRMQGSNPVPAPSQVTIIPMSKWKTSYLWYAYSNGSFQEVFREYYVNVICDKTDYNNGTLQLIQNGGKPTPLKAAGTTSGVKTITGHPELIGITVRTIYGSTYFLRSTTNTSFIAYNYDFKGFDPDRTISNFDGGDHFSSSATAAGFGMPGQGLMGVTESAPSKDLTAYVSERSLVLELPDEVAGTVSVSLYDLLGRKVIDWPAQTASSSISLPLSSISSGVYMVKIQSQQLNATSKVLVQ